MLTFVNESNYPDTFLGVYDLEGKWIGDVVLTDDSIYKFASSSAYYDSEEMYNIAIKLRELNNDKAN